MDEREDVIMKVINFKGFKDVPVCARVMYGIALILAVSGIVTIMLDVFEICEIEVCVSLALCTASLLISTFGLNKYKDKSYKEI